MHLVLDGVQADLAKAVPRIAQEPVLGELDRTKAWACLKTANWGKTTFLW
jgi:hypothetical protein